MRSKVRVTSGGASSSSSVPPSSSSSASGGQGSGSASVVGKYEYVKPGSGGDKSTKWLTLNADGTAIYLEKGEWIKQQYLALFCYFLYISKGETSLESFEINGRGRWQVTGASVEIQFPQLQKQNKLKR